MSIDDAIQILYSAKLMFGGHTDVTFQPPETPGAKTKLKLKNVDSTQPEVEDDDPLTDKDLFIDPGPNRWSRS